MDFTCNCMRRLNHFLYQNRYDLIYCGPISRGDEIRIHVPSGRLWAKGTTSGPPFELPHSEVWDSQYTCAVPLEPSSVKWCISEEADDWQDYPIVLASPIDSWKAWKCGHPSCRCSSADYEEPPHAPGANIGDAVLLMDTKTMEERRWILSLDPDSRRVEKGFLSVYTSPLAKAIHWKREGDLVRVEPQEIEYLVKKVRHRN